jgi:hypothetical protein
VDGNVGRLAAAGADEERAIRRSAAKLRVTAAVLTRRRIRLA